MFTKDILFGMNILTISAPAYQLNHPFRGGRPCGSNMLRATAV
jgi:hypothetical protein